MKGTLSFSPFSPRIIGVILIICAVALAIVSVVTFVRTRNFIRSATRVQGAVVRLQETSDGADITFHPVYHFFDREGVNHQILSSSGSNPAKYAPGDTIAVLYRTKDPDDAEIDSFFDLWGWTVISGGLGIVELVIGLVLLLLPVLKSGFKPKALSIPV